MDVKNSKITYNNKKIILKIWHYMLKYIQSLDKVFANIEQVRAIIARIKSQFCILELKVVEYVCNIKEKYPNTVKIIKILDWSDPINSISV